MTIPIQLGCDIPVATLFAIAASIGSDDESGRCFNVMRIKLSAIIIYEFFCVTVQRFSAIYERAIEIKKDGLGFHSGLMCK
jgi:hypothetical protein